jgi:Ribosomal protein L7/L12 dimerisation domain
MADLQKIVEHLSGLSILEAADLSKMLKERWSAKSNSGGALLFDDRKRTRMEPLQRGDGLFQFYDECGRPGYDEFRSIVNGWLAEMPAEERNDLITRMKNGGDQAFRTSLCELSVHAYLLRCGYKVAVHPRVPESSKRPDFAVADKDGKVLTYVEVTTVNPPREHDADVNRENPVYNAIDKAALPPGSCLGYRLIRAGKHSPALRPLTAEIERWARDNVETAKKEEVSKRFTAGEWVIELDLYAGGDSSDPAPGAIGVVDMKGGIITAREDLRDALDEKSHRYGKLDAPYLIVVADAKDQLFTKESIDAALTDAVLGDEIIQFQGGKAYATRARNGFWHGENGAQNRNVSGVLLLPETGLWRLREEKWQPVLAVNPWAEHRLPPELKRLRRFEAEDNRWAARDGERFADILGLPTPWPPNEPDRADS